MLLLGGSEEEVELVLLTFGDPRQDSIPNLPLNHQLVKVLFKNSSPWNSHL